MLEYIKLAIGAISALMEALPQEFTDVAGVRMKIPDDNYTTLISDCTMAVITGSGFQITGISDTQLRGAVAGFCKVYLAYKKAPRVAI